MKKIKYQGGITKYMTSKLGQYNKSNFADLVEFDLKKIRKQLLNNNISVSLVSFSSNNDFYDQVLSILSFLRYVGTPHSWTVYSDGSHTSSQIQLLKESFEFLILVIDDWGDLDSINKIEKQMLLPYSDFLFDYAIQMPLGKKLFYYLNHIIEQPTIFLDSDILFYNKASCIDLIIQDSVSGWYLPDANWGCLDSRYKERYSKQMYQVNSGFF